MINSNPYVKKEIKKGRKEERKEERKKERKEERKKGTKEGREKKRKKEPIETLARLQLRAYSRYLIIIHITFNFDLPGKRSSILSCPPTR
jgi:hypothetical protein